MAFFSPQRQRPGKVFLLACWLPAIALVQAFFLTLAWRDYPHYAMVRHDISDLGDPRHNPAGWRFWSLAMASAGLMLWPVRVHISRQAAQLAAREQRRVKLIRMGSASSQCSCLGLIALALIPQYRGFDAAHQVAGVFAFGGMYLAVLFFWNCALSDSPLGPVGRLLLTVAAYWGPAGFLATQGYRYFAYHESGDDVSVRHPAFLLSFSLWEWMLYFCLMTALLMYVVVLPNHRDQTLESIS